MIGQLTYIFCTIGLPQYGQLPDWGIAIWTRIVLVEKDCKCDICDFKFASEYHLENHMENVHGENLHHCVECGYESKIKMDLIKHTRNAHKGIHYRCVKCKYNFINRTKLGEHMNKVHTVKKDTYKCDTCDHTFASEYNKKRAYGKCSWRKPSPLRRM